ncbi:hypothetical protein VWF99_10215 [Staphylococcus aureus]
MAVVRGFGVFRCSIYYVPNYSIDEQGVQCIFTILQLMDLIIFELSILKNDLIVES